MPEIQQVVSVSAQGSTNAADWKSLLWTLLIQLAAGAVTGALSYLVYLQNQQEIPAWLAVAIPVAQIVFTQVGKFLQKLLGGPSPTAVRDFHELGITPHGFHKVEALKANAK